MKKIIILLLSCFLFAGCYDYNELNNTAIVSGIAASYKNEKYNITFETIVTKKSESNSSDTKTMLVSSSGKTPAEAFDNTIASVDKKAVFSHLKVVILDETIAKKGIKDLSNYLFRDIHINNTFYYILAKNTEAKKIFETKVKNEPIVANALLDLFENQNSIEMINLNNEFDTLYGRLKENKEDIVIPSVSTNKKNISLETLGVFKKDKLKDFLTKDESKTYNLIKGKVSNLLLDDNNSAVTIYKNKCKMKTDKKNFTLNMSAEGIITSFDTDESLRNGKENKILSKDFSKIIKKKINKLIQTSKDLDSDFLGIGLTYYKKYPNEYKKEIFKNLNYQVNVKAIVNRNGQSFEVIK